MIILQWKGMGFFLPPVWCLHRLYSWLVQMYYKDWGILNSISGPNDNNENKK